jgi:hypothetical protein
MGDWYELGLTAGLGAGLGVLLSGLLGSTRAGIVLALAAAAGGGLLVGLGIGEWDEACSGAAGGALAAAGAAPLVRGALRSGGTRAGTALLVGGAGLLVAGLGAVPGLGYLLPVAVLVLGVRLRGRAPAKYAGLRILAR